MTRKYRIRILTFVLCLSLLGWPAFAGASPGAELLPPSASVPGPGVLPAGPPSPAEPSLPEELSSALGAADDWWATVQQEIAQSEYHITWQESAGPFGAYQAPNRAHNLRISFEPGGIRVIPRVFEGETLPWEWRLALISYHVAGARQGANHLAATAPYPEGNRIEYPRGEITEWYMNDARGLEQGFTLAAPPQSAVSLPSTAVLQIDLALAGNLTTQLTDDGSAIEFITPGGVTVLHYGELIVHDAAGRLLPARLELVPFPSAAFPLLEIIRLSFDAAGAHYPITVDPLATTPDWTVESNQNDAHLGWSVGTAGDVNGDGYSDVVVGVPDYDGGLTDEGRAYVYHGSATGLATSAAWTAESDQAGAQFGYGVGTAGDVDGDGYADVVVGARYYESEVGQADEGRAYVYHGSATGLATSAAWTVESDQAGAQFGYGVGTAGDVNGDGYSDVVVGAPYYEDGPHSDEGCAFVYHGSATGLATSADWTVVSGQDSANLGYAVGAAGDLNGDGYSDVIVGAPYYGLGAQNDEGMAFVYHGSATGLETSAAWTAESDQANAHLGWSAGTAGDVNGDGYSDVVVGVPDFDGGQTDEGRAYVYHGSATGLATSAAWTAESDQAGAQFGYAVGTAGDVDGDGYADVIVGALRYDGGVTDEGRAYAYHGSAAGLATSAAWTAESDQGSAQFGHAVGTVGDVNGDGYSDVVVGAPYYDGGQDNEGRAYAYHGSATGLATSAAWTAESDQSSANLGYAVGTAGDVNGDGYADVVVGVPNYDGGQTDEGRAYVFHGSATGLATSADWTAESDQVGAQFGWSVGTAGDVNGDGYSDVIVGARLYESEVGQTDEGRAYVYHGSATGLGTSAAWTAESDQGSAHFGYAVGTAGDVDGDGYMDVVIGAPLYDNGEAGEGRAYVYHGSTTGLGTSAAWTVESDQANAHLGWSAGTAGDVNRDGYSDILVGAPDYDGGQTDEGRAYVYHGSAAGLAASAAWTAESDQAGAQFGWSVGTAGDVDGDGCSDVVVGAVKYNNGQTGEGRAYVFHGSAAGLATSAAWTVESDQDDAWLGYAVGTAGDVNGDGYSDVVVGAPLYDDGEEDEGRASVYHGSAAGLATSMDWTATGGYTDTQFGAAVAAGGDVNGDGYADLVVGAPDCESEVGQTDEGRAYLYYGNGGIGLALRPRQMRTDGTALIDRLGMSNSRTAFQLRLSARMPLGREDVRLQWQVAPLGTLITATGVISGVSAWTDVGTSGAVISQTVTGLTLNTPYHWRVRLLYRPGNILGQPAGRWVHIPWAGWNESDLRTTPNQRPVANAGPDQDVDTLAGVTLNGSASSDPDGDLPLSYAWAQIGGPVVTFVSSLSVTTFTAPSSPTVLTFSLSVTDSLGLPDLTTDTVVITVNNQPPVAVDDGYTTAEDTPRNVAAPGVLANDDDPDDGPLPMTATLMFSPAHGALDLRGDGSFVYTPTLNWYGVVSFTYIASDGELTDTATVVLTVTAVNDAPVALDNGYTTAEDTSLNVAAPGVLDNDSDVDSATLTAAVETPPAHGALTLNADGSFVYTPTLNWNGVDSFLYIASDGELTDTATVVLTVTAVNDAPVAVDDSYSTDEDVTLVVTAPGVLGNDSDAEGTPLTAALVSSPTHGTLAFSADGSFVYTPTQDWDGYDSFVYVASDGVLTDTATVNLQVIGINAPPVAVDDGYTTAEDTPLNVAAPGVLGNDSDEEGGTLTTTVASSPTHGGLTLNADGSFVYTPTLDWNGVDSFIYIVSDGELTDTATVVLTVTAVNDAPVAVDDGYATAEDTPLNVAAPGVLDNDSDVDSVTLTAAVGTPPAHGALTLNADGSFVYTPTLNWNGVDSFIYIASDGELTDTATVVLTVTAVNDAPLGMDDGYTTAEDTPLNVAAPGVLDNDSDIDLDPLNALLLSGPSNGTLDLNADGSFVYTPTLDWNGVDSFAYIVSDGELTDTATVVLTVTAVNDAPVAVDDGYATAEDTPLNVAAPGVLGNDSDMDSPTLTAAVGTPPAHGALTLNADGSFVYTPTLNWNGVDSFLYIASDGELTDTATVVLTVTAVNDAPVGMDDGYTTAEDTPLNVAALGVLDNDSDIDLDPLNALLLSGPSNGTLTLNAYGSFVYTPTLNWNGVDSFAYIVSDGELTDTATVVLTVTAVNDAPVGMDDGYTTAEDTPLNVAAPGVLDNDSDIDLDPLNALLLSGPSNGTLTLNADGSFVYTPALNWNGVDSFLYIASDGELTDTATVVLTVTAVNDAPLGMDDGYTTAEETPLNVAAPGVLDNDSEIDLDPLNALLLSGPSNGTLALNADGSFVYTPTLNWNGVDSFTYIVSDGELTDTATVVLTVTAVNDAPVGMEDGYTTAEDTPRVVAPPGVLENDSDVDLDPLNAAVESGPAHGALDLYADGSFVYTPTLNWNGVDSFTYIVSDGELTDTATVVLTVTAVNDAPVALDNSYTTAEDTPRVVAAPGVLGNDSDVDLDPLSALLLSGPSNGTLTLNADGSFVYTPTLNWLGVDSFVYIASDGELTDTATVVLNVSAVNDPPEALDDAYATDEDVPLDVAAPGVLGNDDDLDGDSITAAVENPPMTGTLALNANGSFVYTPPLHWHGVTSFTYIVSDGELTDTATVVLTVTAVNDAPVAEDDGYTTDEDVVLVVASPGVLENDSDVDSAALTAAVGTPPAHGGLTLNADGSFVYTPTLDWNGVDSFTYIASDGELTDTATVVLTVTAVNDAPVAVDDGYTTAEDTPLNVVAPGVLGNDSDVDSATLTAAVGTLPAHGGLTLIADGSFVYTPTLNWNGVDSFTYIVSDGELTDTAAVTLTVNSINDAPVAVDDSYSTDEDVTLVVAAPGVLENDGDVDGDLLNAAVANLPMTGTLALSADGAFVYTPTLDWHGVVSFTYIASDGVLTDTAVVTLTVNPVNDSPEALDDAYITDEDVVLLVAAPGVLGNDDDLDGDSLTAAVETPPAYGTLALSPDGALVYTPTLDWCGVDSLTYIASDGELTDTATVVLTVTAVNDAPVALDDEYTTAEDTPLVVPAPGVLENDGDVEGDPLTVVVENPPAHGTLVLDVDGSFTYTPTLDWSDVDSFSYMVSDGALTDTATVVISVTDRPVVAQLELSAERHLLPANGWETSLLTITATDSLGNGAPFSGWVVTLTWSLGLVPSPVTATLNAQGVATVTYVAGIAPGDDLITALVDPNGTPRTATTTITLRVVLLDGDIAVEFTPRLLTYTLVISNIDPLLPHTHVVVSGSVPLDTVPVRGSGGVLVPTGGDYGQGYYESPVIETLAPGERYTLTWTVATLYQVGRIETMGHARSDTSQLRLTLSRTIYRVMLQSIYR